MNTPLRVLGFVAALAAVFGIALATGSAVGPVGAPVAAEAGHADDASHSGDDTAHSGPDAAASSTAHLPGGLMVSQDGYTLSLTEATAAAGTGVPVSFVIEGPDGEPVTDYEVAHEKKLHLIAVRRDLSGFQHVHPTMGRDGVWSTSLDLDPGEWRLYADFTPEGAEGLTLGTDLSVGGDYRPAAPMAPDRVAHVDGYTVTLAGEAVPGADSELTLSVAKDGEAVTDLEPYLGAYGHLVALREGDLAYLHVHATEVPDGPAGDGAQSGPDVVFATSVPSEGSYRLFLDFKHQGRVRTVSFALDTAGHARSDQPPSQSPTHEPHDDPH